MEARAILRSHRKTRLGLAALSITQANNSVDESFQFTLHLSYLAHDGCGYSASSMDACFRVDGRHCLDYVIGIIHGKGDIGGSRHLVFASHEACLSL